MRSTATVVVLLFALTARAEDVVEAKRQFDIGAKAYELGDFAKAIDAYKRSYAAARKPLLLYDLGQAYRKLGDARQALHFYRQYLAIAPTGKYVVEAQQQVSVLTDLVAKLEAARSAPPDAVGTEGEHGNAPSTAHSSPADQETAKALFASASWHYGLNEYRQALEQFQEAYRLFPDSSVLFNIGQCQRQLGLRKEAVASYRGFVKATPDSVKRADAVALIETMESALAAEASQTKQQTTATTPSTAQFTATPPQKERKSRAWVWGVAIGSVVVVGLAVGLGVGLTRPAHYPSPEVVLNGN